MVPISPASRHTYTSRLVYLLFTTASKYVPDLFRRLGGDKTSDSLGRQVLAKRASEFDKHDPKSVAFVVLIPVLVLMSGLFAGLTLGYMSLDETQLNVLSISGTPEQKEYAKKIKPIRKNGHLLLVTLLLANMIVNESLPIIADPILGGGVQSVVVSTVLIVLFAEIIPQSVFTRHGLYLGAKLAGFTRFLIYFLGFLSWPVAKLLELALGPHHGIIYRRAELKELIAMHDAQAIHGGDLKHDTVAIIGATLDLQEKVVRQAMTPIDDVFMLSIDSKLDYALLKKICETGHSRVPVYEEVDVPVPVLQGAGIDTNTSDPLKTVKVKKIIGIFLVKHCVLLDPSDATPLRSLPLNQVPFVPNNEPLLGILDRFQEGRSHMAIVSRFSVEKAASVKKAVKRGLTQRLRERVGMGESSDSDSDQEDKGSLFTRTRRSSKTKFMNVLRRKDVEEGGEDGSIGKEGAEKAPDAPIDAAEDSAEQKPSSKPTKGAKKITSFQLPRISTGMTSMPALEQKMPADAVLGKEGAAQFLQGFDPAVMPLGIITLEDVLEELIGEEIYDEFDSQGAHGELQPYEKDSSLSTPVSDPVSTPVEGAVHQDPIRKSTPRETIIAMPQPVRSLSGGLPTISLERRVTKESEDSETTKADGPPSRRVTPGDAMEESVVVTGTLRSVLPVTATSPGGSRTASPSIEAILLERKRRMLGTAGVGASSSTRDPSPSARVSTGGMGIVGETLLGTTPPSSRPATAHGHGYGTGVGPRGIFKSKTLGVADEQSEVTKESGEGKGKEDKA